MKDQEPAHRESQEQALRYVDYGSLQKRFDALLREGADLRTRRKFITDVFLAKNRAIRDLDFRTLDPRSIEDDYLRPRKELSSFVLRNWVNGVFLPSLDPGLAGEFFLFGLGRMFSAYNDVGVQSCSDADLNFILRDEVPAAGRAVLERELRKLRKEAYDQFGILIEIHPEFTIQDEKSVAAALAHPDPIRRLGSALFYKSNEKSIFVFKDHPDIRARVFSRVSALPDSCLFEHFLGLQSAKNSFMKIRMDKTPLAVLEEYTCEQIPAREVIGSRAFGQYCFKVFRKVPFASPPVWYFSMKYFVNRVYDYVCAMRNMGYGLPQIGFDSEDSRGGPDPDFLFLRNAHKLMLYLQELIQLSLESFGMDCDYSYISRARFLKFIEIDGEKFRKNFEELVLGGGLLPPTARDKFLRLKRKVQEKSRDRIVYCDGKDLEGFPGGFKYETIDRDSAMFRICVPYSWADLGFFVFNVIAARIGQIVDSRLLPPLARLDAGGGLSTDAAESAPRPRRRSPHSA